MKKIKKILSVLSAAAVLAVGTMPVSADDNYGSIDTDNLIFKASSKFVENAPVNDHFEFWIDKDYHAWGASFYNSGYAVRVTDDTVLPNVISNKLQARKLSKPQIAQMQDGVKEDSCWNGVDKIFSDADVKITDRIYRISGFDDTAAKEYCQKLIDEGKADHMDKIVNGEYGRAGSDLDCCYFLERQGIESDGFDDDSFVFKFSLKDNDAAKSFDPASIEGFKENLHVMTIKDNKIYFQFKDNAIDKTTVNILNALQNTEGISELYPFIYGVQASATIDNMPAYYEQGDVNQNDSIDLQDAIEVSKYMLGSTEFDTPQKYLADFNDDGEVELQDVIGIAKKIINQ